MRASELQLTSWGRNKYAEMTVYRPERNAHIATAVLGGGSNGTIAHGHGRNYGDLSICSGGTAIMTTRLDRILEFDETTGTIALEPGVTFKDLFHFVSERGFLPPVTPGTAFVTLGGGVATDIHGKNHDRDGSLGHHIEWLDIVLADGTTTRASATERPTLFAATIGGCGLTGVISAIGLRLRRQRANAVETREYRVRDLDHFFELMSEYRNSSTYTVGWVDALQKGRSLGRGIFQVAEPIYKPDLTFQKKNLSVPEIFPNRMLNRYFIGLFNALYYRRIPEQGCIRTIEYSAFHHPLDAINNWNRLYGSAGFFQFQCVLPDASSLTGVKTLLEQVATAGAASFLGVLKTLGMNGIGYLSFPQAGVTLSLDLPARPETMALLHALEATTLDHGGRLYLAKDAAMSPEGFAQMYPQLDSFRTVLEEFDPDGKFNSDMARRLKIRDST